MFSVDICLCEGNTCPLKERCLRYTYHLKDIASGVENYNTYFVDAKDEAIACNTRSDIKALEDSVSDAKIAYEVDYENAIHILREIL